MAEFQRGSRVEWVGVASRLASSRSEERVNRVLPTLKEMAAHRLIVRENVVLEQGNLD